MKILIACEFSGIVRDAFRAWGPMTCTTNNENGFCSHCGEMHGENMNTNEKPESNYHPFQFPKDPPQFTLRDYFAAAALTGMMSQESMFEALSEKIIALMAYQQADEMIKAREL